MTVGVRTSQTTCRIVYNTPGSLDLQLLNEQIDGTQMLLTILLLYNRTQPLLGPDLELDAYTTLESLKANAARFGVLSLSYNSPFEMVLSDFPAVATAATASLLALPKILRDFSRLRVHFIRDSLERQELKEQDLLLSEAQAARLALTPELRRLEELTPTQQQILEANLERQAAILRQIDRVVSTSGDVQVDSKEDESL